MRAEIEVLIDRLTRCPHAPNCILSVCMKDGKFTECPVLIGTLLEEIKWRMHVALDVYHFQNIEARKEVVGRFIEIQHDLVRLWEQVGFTKSLKKIHDATKWHDLFADEGKDIQVPKQKPHREFWSFLIQLGL